MASCEDSKTVTKIRKSYDANFKLQAVQFVKENSKEAAGRRFNVDAKRIREWCKQEEELQNMIKHYGSKRKRMEGAGRKLTSEHLDQMVFDWIQGQRSLKRMVSRKSIMRKATELFGKENFDDTTKENFKASRGWIDKFMTRHRLAIRKRTTVCQKTPEQLIPKLVNFVIHIRDARLKFNYPLASIGAMDETAVWVDMVAETTVDNVGAKTVAVKSTGNQKNRFTVCLTAKANGVKLPPFIVFKGKRQDPALSQIPGICVSYSSNGWMNDDLTIQWLQKIWGIFAFGKRLLVWDCYRCHISVATKAEVSKLQTHMTVIPGGCTGLIQAPDVVWNAPFKVAYRELYEEWMSDGEHSFTPAGNMRPPTRLLMCQWVKKAWETCLTRDQVASSFKSCGITINTDGSEDDMITCFKEGREAEGAIPCLKVEHANLLRAHVEDARDPFEEFDHPQSEDEEELERNELVIEEDLDGDLDV